jgi:glycerophosphoryl diester phosphodiesterase
MIGKALARWRQAVDDIKAQWRPLVIFQIWFAIFGTALFAPVSVWILDRIVISSGHVAISNYDLAAFFLSLRGVIFIAWVCLSWFAILLAEAAGLILLCAGSRAANLSPAEVLSQTLRSLPEIAQLGFWVGAALALLAVPFVLLGAGIANVMLGSHDINYYLYHQPGEWWVTLAFGAVLALTNVVAAAALCVRFMFALPLMLFDRQSPRTALRGSWALTRQNVTTSLYVVAGWWVLMSLIAGALTLIVTTIGIWLLSTAGERLLVALLVMGGALTLLVIIGVLWALVAKSGAAMLVVGLFRTAGGNISGKTAGAESTNNLARLPSSKSIGIILGLVFSVAVTFSAIDLFSIRMEETFAVTAHRAGAIHAPENTLAALERAIADGADYAEIDVQTTRDGAVVVIHDADLKRVANDARTVATLRSDDLRMLDVGSWHDPVFSEERVPLLTEMIAMARGRIKLNIELKYNRVDPVLAPKVVEILHAERFTDQCVITSLDVASLNQVRSLDPFLSTGLIVTQAVGDPARVSTDFLAVNQKAATEAFVSRAADRGKPVHVWTVNSRADLERAVERGSSNLITDRPAEAVALRVEREQMPVSALLILRLRRVLID